MMSALSRTGGSVLPPFSLEWPPISHKLAVEQVTKLLNDCAASHSALPTCPQLFFSSPDSPNKHKKSGEPFHPIVEVCIAAANSGGGVVVCGAQSDGTLHGYSGAINEVSVLQHIVETRTDPQFNHSETYISSSSSISFYYEITAVGTRNYVIISVAGSSASALCWTPLLPTHANDPLHTAFKERSSIRWNSVGKPQVVLHRSSHGDIHKACGGVDERRSLGRKICSPMSSNQSRLAQPTQIIESQLSRLAAPQMSTLTSSTIVFGLAAYSGIPVPLLFNNTTFLEDEISSVVVNTIRDSVYPPLDSYASIKVDVYVLDDVKEVCWANGTAYVVKEHMMQPFTTDAQVREAVQAYEDAVAAPGVTTDSSGDTFPPIYLTNASASTAFLPFWLGDALKTRTDLIEVFTDAPPSNLQAAVVIKVTLPPHDCVDPQSLHAYRFTPAMHIQRMQFWELWRRILCKHTDAHMLAPLRVDEPGFAQ